MAKSKKFFWLKLKEDFFSLIEIRRLLNMKNGEKYTIILLRIILSTVRYGGYLTYQGYEKSLSEQLALVIGEKPKDVGFVLNYLEQINWLLQSSENPNSFGIKPAIECTGSETDSAQRMRNYRSKDEREANNNVTLCEKNVTMLQKSVTLCAESDTKVTDIQNEKKIKSADEDTESADTLTVADFELLRERKKLQ